MKGGLIFAIGALVGAAAVRAVASGARVGTLTLSEAELRKLCAHGEPIRLTVIGAAIIPPDVPPETLAACISNLNVIGYASMSRTAHHALRGRFQVSGTAVVD